MKGNEQEPTVGQLRQRYWDLKAREADLLTQAEVLAGQIRTIRHTSGNPFFYRGTTHAREENAEKSEERFTGYSSHEAGLLLFQELSSARSEMRRIRKQLQAAGFDID